MPAHDFRPSLYNLAGSRVLVVEAGEGACFGLLRTTGVTTVKRFVFLCAAGVGVGLPACGSLDSDTSSTPTLATLHGSLINPSSVDIPNASAVRVAVVWRGGIGGSEAQFSVAEDLPVQAVFPSSFTIDFTSAPAQAAMNTESGVAVIWCIPDSGIPVSPLCALVDGGRPTGAGADEGGPPPTGPDAQGTAVPVSGDDDDAATAPPPTVPPLDAPTGEGSVGSYAIGTVVAYLDQNHNGKLDLVGEDASAYVDQIIAANQEMTIVYLQGAITDTLFTPLVDSLGHRPTDGYNLLFDPCSTLVAHPVSPTCPTAPTPDAGLCNTPFQWLGMSTAYPLTVASSPEVSSMMCTTQTPGFTVGEGPVPPFDPAVQPAQYPSPSDPGVCCASDGSDYLFTTCTTASQGLCKGTIETCTSVGYERPTPAPAAWPCAN
jgi:hypothetical protein